MQQYDEQYSYFLDTIAIHIKQTVRILYSSIDKINKPHNVQLILHSSILFFYQKSFTMVYFCMVIFGQEEKQKQVET